MKFLVSDVVLDIEGTTCPVDFVANTLFPFALDNLTSYIEEHHAESAVATLLTEADHAWNADPDPEAIALRKAVGSGEGLKATERVASYLSHLIRVDRKLPALKELQGMIWAEAYANGKLLAPLFPEVGTTLSSWRGQGIRLSVYSSGSVAAQKMLYRYSTAGDLTDFFDAWFDTRIGAKTESASYLNIADSLAIKPGMGLFISDSVAELNAANSAGFKVCFSDREGNPQRGPTPYPSVTRLDQIHPLPPPE